MAGILTITAILDYLWDRMKDGISGKTRQRNVRNIMIAALISISWILAIIQARKDHQSDADTEFIKQQLVFANVSLTNSTQTIKGMIDGGDAYVEPVFEQPIFEQIDGNVLEVYASNKSTNFYARNVLSLIQNEYNLNGVAMGQDYRTNIGDVTFGSYLNDKYVGMLALEPKTHNRIIVEFYLQNGFSYYVYDFWVSTNGWQKKLTSSTRQTGGRNFDYPPD